MKKIELNNRSDYCPNCTKVYFDSNTAWGPLAPRIYSDKTVWLVKKIGKYGPFLGCPNFPKCKYTLSSERKENYIDYEDELRPY